MKTSSLNKENNFNIYFSNYFIDIEKIKPPAIIFTPIDDRWNDFKYRCRYKYTIYLGGNQINIEGELFLGFISNNQKINEDGRLSKDIDIIEANELPIFFTLQGGMEDYRHFIREHGVTESKYLLLALNDLVATKKNSTKSKFIESAIKTRVFNLAFMRDSERFFAFYNAGSIIDGLDGETFSSVSTQLSLTYELSGFTRKHFFDLNFDTESILPKRMGILIGRNGLGKSQALYTIVRSLLNGDNKFYDRELGRPMISRILAIATPGETINSFPRERANKRIKYRRLILNSTKIRLSSGFGTLCVQLARSEETIGNNSRWELFIESIRMLSGIGNIVIPLKKDISIEANHLLKVKGKFYVPILRLNHGGEQEKLELQGNIANYSNPMFYIDNKLLPLSSGQSAFIKFAVQACLFIENGTLVLFDEPETHLHPNFISEFVRILDRLLKLTGSISIIATHSAYFVREVPRTQALVFKEESSGNISIQNPRLKTFGADVGAISYFVFEDEITNVLVDNILEQFPKKLDKQQSLLSELENELSADVIMYLRRKLKIGVSNEKN